VFCSKAANAVRLSKRVLVLGKQAVFFPGSRQIAKTKKGDQLIPLKLS